MDIITQPLLSATDFQNRINNWIKEVDEQEGGRDKALVGFFGQVKKNVTDSGKDFQKIIEGPCKRYADSFAVPSGTGTDPRLGIAVVPGSIIWHAMKLGSVQAYVDANPDGPRTAAGKLTLSESSHPKLMIATASMQSRRTQVPETVAAVAETRSLTPPPSESTAKVSQPSPTQGQVASVIAETEPTKMEPSANLTQDPEPEPPSAQPPSTARRVSYQARPDEQS